MERIWREGVFSGLDLALARGEWAAAATGPSGCGKTSLGDVLLGLRAPAAGRVRRAPGTARTAFQKAYQDPVAAFAPRTTLRAALSAAAWLHGVPWPRVRALLARLRVAEALLTRRPDQVSGGELQRVALARALLPDPVFLFAGEPTSRPDPVTQQETMALLREVSAERGLAVLLVTHDAAMAGKMAGAGRVLALAR
jgi:peptide/nickel transport system ATP-binding protein